MRIYEKEQTLHDLCIRINILYNYIHNFKENLEDNDKIDFKSMSTNQGFFYA